MWLGPATLIITMSDSRKQPNAADDTVVYLLRGIPRPIWFRARMRALSEGRSIRDVLLSLLTEYAKGPVTTTWKRRGK
jgi:hypothetical protein